ncbi:MAG: leucine-rich repeat domain-containing protein, partial [Candidatus Methanomethylophilaceae archaeon]|nr:leucine-rich repeat domain-containing protein [Candidatus Methanomethylophilaceae archaeon]
MKPRSIFAVVAVMALVMVAVPVSGVDSSYEISADTASGGSTDPIEYKGTCGIDLVWTFDGKTLTIEDDNPVNNCKLDAIGIWKITSPSNSDTTVSKLLNDNKGFKLEVKAAKLTTLGTVFKGSYVGSVDLGNNVTTIPSSGFEKCTSLTTISLTKVTSIGASAFKGCTNLKTVNMPSDAIKLESSTFEECESLTTISLTKVASIGEYCFMKCTSLKISDIPNNITHLGAGCFKGCTSLGTVTFTAPSSSATSYVKSIPDGAFDGCTSLSEVNLNDRIEDIGKNAFKGTKLLDINLKNVKTINQDAFAGVTTLDKFEIGTYNTSFYTDSTGAFLYSKDKTKLLMVANKKAGTLYADDLESSVQTIYLGYAAVTFILDDTKDCYTFKIGASTPKAIGILYSTQGVDGTISPIISSGKLSATYKLYDGWVSDKYVVKAYKA